jgi:hypothetical protein
VFDRVDRGLLQRITRKDISNTDLYVSTLDDILIFERKGIRANETEGLVFEGNCPDSDGKWCLPEEGAPYKARFHFQAYVPMRFNVSQFKVWLVNRATGYVGMARARLDNQNITQPGYTPQPNEVASLPVIRIEGDTTTNGDPSSYHPTTGQTNAALPDDATCDLNGQPKGLICLRPPNLKVRVERFRQERETSDGSATQQVDPIFDVGFEGSALTSDNWVRITTDFKNWDGSALPIGFPGFTGRLAKVVAEHQLGEPEGEVENDDEESNFVGHFKIGPNEETQVLRLPAGD